MRRLVFPLVVFAVLCAAAPARSQGFVSPFAGYDYGDSAGNCPSFFNDCSERKTSYGIVFGGLSGGILGFEQDISFAPDFFGKSTEFGENSVLTLMSNIVVAIPAGRLRPYGSIGIGLMKTKVKFTAADLADFSDTSLAYDLGAGLMVLLPSHLGLRLDFRRFRTRAGLSIAGIGLDDAKLKFSRISVGVVLH